MPGNPELRKKIEDYQLILLKNRQTIMPMFQEFVKQKNYTFRIPLDKVLDYCVLEYSFALWQWGNMVVKVPNANAPVDELFKHLMIVSGPSYFALEEMKGIQPFFVQVARELRYYGYDTKPFEKYLVIATAEKYLPKIFLPDGLKVKFRPKFAKKVHRFIQNSDEKMIFSQT